MEESQISEENIKMISNTIVHPFHSPDKSDNPQAGMDDEIQSL